MKNVLHETTRSRIIKFLLVPAFVLALGIQFQFGGGALFTDVTSGSCAYTMNVSGTMAVHNGDNPSYVVTITSANCAAVTKNISLVYPTSTPVPQCSISGSGELAVPANGSASSTINCTIGSSVTPGSYTYTVNATSPTGTGSIPLTLAVSASTTAASCTGFTLTTDKSTYAKGDMVNYVYTCNPAGTRGNATVQVVKPDGIATTYNSGTNIDTASLGFSTSNLTAGSYTLRVCTSSDCTSGMTSMNFTVTDTTASGSGSGSGSGTGSGSGSGSGSGYGSGSSSMCTNGQKCPAGTACQNGKSYYYPTGEVMCVAWSTDGQMTTAPAGTSPCSPTDKQCTASGSYGPSTGWCVDGMKFYQKVADTNPNNDIYCAAWTYMGMGAVSQQPTGPAGYGACSPSDTNCKEKGDTWAAGNTTAWCSNSTSCSIAGGGGTCVGMGESCPKGTKSCPSSTMGGNDSCIEPGEYKTYSTTSTSNGYWCGGGGGMTFYSATQAYCAPKSSSSGMMWTSADVKNVLSTLGSGWGVCNPKMTMAYGSGKCFEPGKTTTSASDWCGWWPPSQVAYSMPNGPRTCPALDSMTPDVKTTPVDVKVPPVPPVPPVDVKKIPEILPIDPNTKEPTVKPPVKEPVPEPPFSTNPLPLIKGMNQCRMLRTNIRMSRSEIRDIQQNLKYFPKHFEGLQDIKDSLSSASSLYTSLEQDLNRVTNKACTGTSYMAFKNRVIELTSEMESLRDSTQNLQAYKRLLILQKNIQQRIKSLQRDQKKFDGALDESITQMKDLYARVRASTQDDTLDTIMVEDYEAEQSDLESVIRDIYQPPATEDL